MRARKHKTLSTTHDADQLFAAVVRAVEGGRYTVTGRDDTVRQLRFTSGKTAFSWGHVFVADVVHRSSGSTLNVTCGGVDGRPSALLDGRKNSLAAEALITAVERDLPA